VAINPNNADHVVCGTNGTDSAFSQSFNGAVSWNETGLIDNAGAALAVIGEVVLSPNYVNDHTFYIVTNNASGASDTSVWRTTDGGLHFTRLMEGNFLAAGGGVIALSNGFASDGTLYVADLGTANLWYSADRGTTWQARNVTIGGFTIADLAAPNSTTLYAANATVGTVAKTLNSGWVWAGGANIATGGISCRDIKINSDGSVVVVGDNGGAVYRSTTSGTAYARVGAPISATPQFVAFDGDTVYAMDAATGNISRFVIGTSTAWLTIDTGTAAGGEIMLAEDGTLYAVDPTVAANTQVRRSINPTATTPFFEWMTGLGAAAAGQLAVTTASSNEVIVQQGAALFTYLDVLSRGSPAPTVNAPVDGYDVEVNTAVTFSIVNDPAQVTNWQIFLSNDPAFTNSAAFVNQVPPSTQVVVNLTAIGLSVEQPMYWMARATAPLRGMFSASRTLNPQPALGINAPVLLGPVGVAAQSVPVMATFSWSAFKSATGYHLQVTKLGSEADFSEDKLVVDEVMGPVTSYAVSEPLEYAAVYAWRVKALTATGETDWSAAQGFTTVDEPVEPQPPVVIEPSDPPEIIVETPPPPPDIVIEQPQITPGWIYGIIAVGGVLVVVVIVLIMRTRRVP
jgi:hypothetical protein